MNCVAPPREGRNRLPTTRFSLRYAETRPHSEITRMAANCRRGGAKDPLKLFQHLDFESGNLAAVMSTGSGPHPRLQRRYLMDQDRTKDWRELCSAAANEVDPAKLMNLIAELTKALDERDKKRRTNTAENPENNSRGARALHRELAV